MVMVDRLLHCDPVLTTTSFGVKADCIMVDDGCLSAIGLIENIAQTCAARMGYINLNSGKEVQIGVIGALRDLVVHALPSVGETLTTSIEVSDEVFGMTLAKATTHSGNTLLCSGTIKIALL